MTRYVCGFLFNPQRTRVALIRKVKPTWQAGLLNGIGGKIEEGETPAEAMEREFVEEANVAFCNWQEFAVLTGPDFQIHFFSAFDSGIDYVCTNEDKGEVVSVERIQTLTLRPDVIPNLRVLIPLALDDTGIKKPVMLDDVRRAA
jgi:8-oxo-dGTP diphosphatase